VFDLNEATEAASGAFAMLSQSLLVASNTMFLSNSAASFAGAIGTFEASSAELTDVSVISIYYYQICS
jgi:hypothetical protein